MQIYREFIEALRGRRRTFASDPPLWRRFEIRRVLVSPLLPNIFSFVNIQVIDIFFFIFSLNEFPNFESQHYNFIIGGNH